MTDLVEFLTARIDEDEQLARTVEQAVGAERKGEPYSDGSGIAAGDAFPTYPWGMVPEELPFMAGAGHPSRVLADVAAKRAILAAHPPVRFTDATLGLHDVEVCWRCHVRLDYPDDWDEQGAEGWTYPLVQERFPCGTVRALALPYRSHPDFNPAWEVA
ncbi:MULTISPECIES: DUF6221 family protein [Pseudonocardia]|uniref:Uncharacterized protein n=2 Tax=Pseudonocardia TaxID=1847 RepID=A0A1Y2N719_PSEAH|nr:MULTISPECIES: DUF6221 family protein [Pseudonocardia]OSY42971.1 hypothetical protein BG845_01213 [Pseudonocardia autotrophica]TDN77547.1 hypothetical protein C8E95_6795 [Pseudonocardia autotrophica]BBG01575.1 hypothetical protein Pdca_27840 [Pseudonocardia autotrophica]GEC29076.1 hypothetical protein PSA01_61050 [Pseudonocardia saturnea]